MHENELVRAWKDPYHRRSTGMTVANPVGEVLLDAALDDIIGGAQTADSGGTMPGSSSDWPSIRG